jgi:ribosome biogenesis GTPase
MRLAFPARTAATIAACTAGWINEPGRKDVSAPFEALVRVSYGSHGVVQTANGRRLDCKYRRQVGRPCCGDRVLVVLIGDDEGVVTEILPRKNRFLRADAQQKTSVVAANLDQVLIIIAPRPLPSRDIVDRYLLAVHSLDISPVIVLNKSELPIEDPDSPGGKVLTRLSDYQQLGYPVVRTSCKEAPGIDDLLPLLESRTSILVGQSGVGKSSLVRNILPDLEIQTGALSRSTGKGRHTTTTTILYDLPGAGGLMDSPGVWEYGLWNLEPEEIAQGFVEFRPFLGHCRFNNCRHLAEPGCAVKRACEEGQILAWRYAAYCRILQQN